MAQLQVLNPVAQTVQQTIPPAPRLPELQGKRIGLYWNMKAGGDIALERVAEHLTAQYPGVSVQQFVGSVGHIMRHLTDEDADRIAKECDAVVGTTSD
ncbi:MAG: hypothetical protein D6736_07270 [Nitrospinota bacterium]|nr:MAG: hypothetical protein D6736_07270 [Nitrospinota bacterium]